MNCASAILRKCHATNPRYPHHLIVNPHWGRGQGRSIRLCRMQHALLVQRVGDWDMQANQVKARTLTPRQVGGVVAGNVLEFYDFTVFAFFAAQIGQAMFADGHGSDGLLAALASFAVGFVARPVGAAVIGRYADKVGRKPAMVLSFTLMGLALIVLALTPPASAIGGWSAVIVSAARLVQGFALGGEVGPATALLIEAAPPNRRGFYGSWQFACQGAAILLAGMVGLTITMVLTPQQVIDWGWRIALLFGALVLPVGFYLRRILPETLGHSESPAMPQAAPVPALGRVVVLGLLLVLSGTVTNYTLQYFNTFAVSALNLAPSTAFLATVITGVSMFVASLIGGAMSDRFGRRRLVLWPRAILFAVVFPLISQLVKEPSLLLLALNAFVLTTLYALSTAPANVWLAESFPQNQRSTGYALTYTIAVSVFGGGAQFGITWMMQHFGDKLMPAWWLIGATLVAIVAGIAMPAVRRETPRGRAIEAFPE
jgi:MFS family permease